MYSQLITPHVRSSWYNQPRRRRHLMKEVLQWHMLHEVLLDEVEQRLPNVSPYSWSAFNNRKRLYIYVGRTHNENFVGDPSSSPAWAIICLSRSHHLWFSARAVRTGGKADSLLVLVPRSGRAHELHRESIALSSPRYDSCCLSYRGC